MICILEGHKPQRYPGEGPHRGREFDVCVECGRTWPVVNGRRAAEALHQDDQPRMTA